MYSVQHWITSCPGSKIPDHRFIHDIKDSMGCVNTNVVSLLLSLKDTSNKLTRLLVSVYGRDENNSETWKSPDPPKIFFLQKCFFSNFNRFFRTGNKTVTNDIPKSEKKTFPKNWLTGVRDSIFWTSRSESFLMMCRSTSEISLWVLNTLSPNFKLPDNHDHTHNHCGFVKPNGFVDDLEDSHVGKVMSDFVV